MAATLAADRTPAPPSRCMRAKASTSAAVAQISPAGPVQRGSSDVGASRTGSRRRPPPPRLAGLDEMPVRDPVAQLLLGERDGVRKPERLQQPLAQRRVP